MVGREGEREDGEGRREVGKNAVIWSTIISDLKVTVLRCLGEELYQYFNFCLFGCFYDGLDILAT